MALTPGTRLGPYEILSPLGVGGMGEVYRATDSNLKRSVAIKVLPASVAGDTDRLARFQREAEVLAALNHPNIAAVYGLEKADGTVALVMELVEGDDLSQRIAKGAIPVDEALPIAKQIADALEAAHEQGIVHRDLKPANIKVRADGTVKVLDFGLAKAMEPAAGSSSNMSQSPTLTTPAMTQAGMILGTAAYMSPEQAKSRPIDKRTDVWAFGAVLYEMLSGRRAFDGEDVSDTLARILMKEPDWTAIPATVPSAVVTVVRRCLQKDRKQRVRDIGDVSLALEGAFETPSPADAGLRAVAAPRSVVARALPAVAAVLPVLVVALGIAVWAPWRSAKPADRPLVRLDVDLGVDAAFPVATTNSGSTIAISPDGTRLVYVSGNPRKLFTRRLDQPKAIELPGTLDAGRPFFSPDGQWLGFAVGRKVNKISVEGGAVVPLGEVGTVFAGASWAEDGSLFVSDGNGGKGLLQLAAAGGASRIVAPLGNGESALAVPQLLPGGAAILFATATTDPNFADTTNIEVLTLADGRRKILARGGQSPHYLPSSNGTGHLVYVNKATLFAIPFDLDTLETRGTAVPILDDVAYSVLTGTSHFDVSRTGTLIYRRATGDAASMTTVQWVNSTGTKEPLLAKPGPYQNPRISPDGTRIALVIPEGASGDMWVYDLRRDAITRLSFGGINRFPAWSPDSQYVVFEKPGQGIFQARADGASPPQALTGSKTTQVPWSFTPDGKRLAYVETTGGGQIWTVPLEDQGGHLTAGKPEQFHKSSFRDQFPSFSPDARWLAYQSNKAGQVNVYVRAFPPPSASSSGSAGEGSEWQVSNNGGTDPHWSRTGHELMYTSGDQLMAVSYSVNGNTFVAEKPRVWIAPLAGASLGEWDLAPDGKRVAVVIPEGTAQAPQQEHEIVMLQNFADELRRRVPLGK